MTIRAQQGGQGWSVDGLPSSRPAWLLPLLLGAALRLYAAWPPRPLWLDEAITANAAHSADPLAAVLTTDLHPPWLVLLLAALDLRAEWALRAPSWLASVLTIPALAWAAGGDPADGRLPTGPSPPPDRAGARRSSAQAAALAAWLAAFDPAWVRYAGEARPYALAVLATTLLCGSALRRSRSGLTLSACLALGATWGAWPVVAAVALWHLWTTRDPRPWLAPTLLALALLRFVALPQLAGPGAGLQDGWLTTYLPHTPLAVAEAVLDTLGWSLVGSDGPDALLVGLLLSPLLTRPQVLLPLLLALAAAMAGLHPLGATRHVLPLTPCVLLALAQAWSRLPARGQPGLTAVLAAILLRALVTDRGLPVQDTPGLLQELDGAPLIADGSLGPAVSWYAPDRLQRVLPWRRPERVPEGLRDLPPGPFWLVAASGRLGEAEAQALAAQGLRVEERVERQGVVGWRVVGR